MKCTFNNGTYETSNFTQKEKCEIYTKYLNSNISNQAENYNCSLDDSYYYSLVNEWELICDKKYLASLIQTLYLLGTICGLVFGFFSDKYGRKSTALVISIVFCFVLGFSEVMQLDAFKLSINAKFIIYCICQFILGGMAKGLYLVVYILLIEMTISKYNTIVSNINLYMYVGGELLILVIAYFFKNWHIMNVTITAYSSIFIFVIAFLLPESPRFLISKNKKDQAVKVLTKFAKYNGKSTETIQKYSKEQSASLINKDNNDNNSIDSENVSLGESVNNEESGKLTKKEQTFIEIFKPRANLIKTCLFMYMWFALNLVYYGVSLGITGLDDQVNPYLMYLLSSLAELVGYILCHLNDKFGRKRTLIFFLISSGVFCLIVAILPTSNNESSGSLSYLTIFKIIFASIGKSMASAAFNSAYIYNSLLYSTAIRSTAVLFSSNIGGIGSFISPQINILQSLVWRPLPYVIFGTSSFLAGIFVLLLPDPDKIKFF